MPYLSLTVVPSIPSCHRCFLFRRPSGRGVVVVVPGLGVVVVVVVIVVVVVGERPGGYLVLLVVTDLLRSTCLVVVVVGLQLVGVCCEVSLWDVK